MEYRTHLQCAFRDTESPLHHPKFSVKADHLFWGEVGVGDITFPSIPLCVFLYLSIID